MAPFFSNILYIYTVHINYLFQCKYLLIFNLLIQEILTDDKICFLDNVQNMLIVTQIFKSEIISH